MAKKNQTEVDLLEINGLSSIVREVNNEKTEKPKENPSSRNEEKNNQSKGKEKNDVWEKLIENVKYYKENPTKGQAIWIDDDIKDSLEMMKGGPLKCSVKTLANAMLRTFIEQNRENCKKYTGESKKGLL